MYDLTAVLTTIAAASGSIVAIVGGFIASKLISISGERESVLNQIHNIDEELEYRQSVKQELQDSNDADDALDFIREHDMDLLNDENLSEIYAKESNVSLSEERLLPFWKRAKEVVKLFYDAVDDDTEINDNNVPETLAASLRDDFFAGEVCKIIGKLFKKIERHNNSDPFASFYSRIDTDALIPNITSLDYRRNESEIAKHQSAIDLLNLQKKQLQEQMTALRTPRGMKSGLFVFCVFTIICIIVPLCLSPFQTDNYDCYLATKYIAIGLFALGMTMIFAYLANLLKWKTKNKK